MTFHLHKVSDSVFSIGFITVSCVLTVRRNVYFNFPFMAKSKKLHEMITEQEKNDTAESVTENSKNEEIREETDTEHAHITLPDFPGGSETFEAAVKYCYSVKIELTPLNVALLRCAGEVLEMTEEYCEDNLISKTEWFLSQTVFKSLKNSIKTLKSCEDLFLMDEEKGKKK
ncbi:putative chromatin remodeling & transcription regulator BTB-POZ family [Helianthus debilis subsp. tardiflorus]